MYVETWHCPDCGASGASDKTVCEFCGARLVTMMCPKCALRLWTGSKFCPGCGELLTHINVSLDEKAGDCPRCHSSLEGMDVANTHFRGCSKCDGIWMSADAFEQTCADAERRTRVLGYFRDRPSRTITATKIAYVPCPDCGQLMNRSNFARASGVIVDICKGHGVWFDADELPSIIEFVQKGGMEIARNRQINELENERDRFRTRRLDPASALIMDDHDTGLNIRHFVRKLFD